MEGHEDKQETQTGDHADNWTDADWWSNDWSTDLWTDPAWEQAARQLPSTQPAQEQSNPTQGGNISMSGGLTMCELSVDDGEQQNEQDEVDRNWRDDWSQIETWVQNEMANGHKIEKWFQNEVTNGHKIENWVQNEMMNDHKIENWVQNELTDGHKSWNNGIWHRKWIQGKMTDGYENRNKSWNTSRCKKWIQNKLTGGHNVCNRNSREDGVRDKLTSHSIESVGQAASVRSDKRHRQITFGIDTAARRTVVPARHPATRIYRCHWDTKAGVQHSTAGKSVVWHQGRILLVSKDTEGKLVTIESGQAEVRRPLMAVKPMTQQGQWVCFGLDRAFTFKIEIGKVIPFESAPNGWNLTVELEAPNDAINSMLQEITDILVTEKRLEQTEKIEHKRGLPDVIKQMLTGRKNVSSLQPFGCRAQTCKTTGTIVGTVDLDRRRRDNDGLSWLLLTRVRRAQSGQNSYQ